MPIQEDQMAPKGYILSTWLIICPSLKWGSPSSKSGLCGGVAKDRTQLIVSRISARGTHVPLIHIVLNGAALRRPHKGAVGLRVVIEGPIDRR